VANKILWIFLFLGACAPAQKSKAALVPHVVPTVVRTIPHDTSAFTQGLLYADGRLYESTGKYGSSSLRILNPSDGSIISLKPVDKIFAEGLALKDGRLVQLSWQEQVAIVYRISDFTIAKVFDYAGEGWGLTVVNSRYVMSNGSDSLFFRDDNFAIKGVKVVTLMGRPLFRINELEYANGKIYANMWYSTYIFEIDPESGVVIRTIDCTGIALENQSENQDAVLNGIAFNAESGTFYITGKNWPNMYEIRIP
jgi:glutamine cyclotransferase